MGDNGSARLVVKVADNSISVLDDLKIVPHRVCGDVHILCDFKVEDLLFCGQRAVEYFALLVVNVALMGRTYSKELQEFDYSLR